MTLVLGIDGGNTKTVALVAHGDGTVVGAGRAGCADIYGADSPEAAIDAIVAAAQGALAEAGVTGADLDAAVFCLAGADWPEDFALHHRELTARLGLRQTATVFNDAIATLRAGTPDAVGVAAVVGTGGAIAGRNADGRTWHLGFWPDSLAAVGIARAGLRAVYRNGLGHDVPTTMTARALELFGVPDEIELLHRFSRRGPRPAVVSMVPIVLEEAAAGDAVALAIIEADAARFADAVRTTAAAARAAGAVRAGAGGWRAASSGRALHADAVAPRRARRDHGAGDVGTGGGSAAAGMRRGRRGPGPGRAAGHAARGDVLRNALGPVTRTEVLPPRNGPAAYRPSPPAHGPCQSAHFARLPRGNVLGSDPRTGVFGVRPRTWNTRGRRAEVEPR